MITGEKDKLEEIAKHSRCPEHDNPLVVAWHDGENAYVLRCGKGHFPLEVTQIPGRTQQFKRGELEKVDKSFNLLPRADLETGEQLSLDKVDALVKYARRYDLDPYRGHIQMMHGAPYVSIDGYLYHAHKEKIPYSLTGRPLTKPELKAQGYAPDDLGWYSKVERLDTGQVFEGYGFIMAAELTEMSKKHPDRPRYPVVAAKPGVMVVKRADWQALRRAFPIGETEEGEEK